ncbi:MAG: DUF86 domain-containing protein [Prevotella sp.]|nr:DUF86 domain-containing protein [Prevotella sp.]MBQ9560977.1 DUF86 domain-containing protein [Prevotella sp.]MBR1840173.1 DUF86 domain-containing protein [Prevotella sp.]
MRERARDKGRLLDIIEYADNVSMLMEGFDYSKLVADKRTYYSVIKNIEVVGEAAYMLTKAFKREHPSTPWKFVQGMRHVLVHDYATIDDKELYNTAVNDIPVLRSQVAQYLAETDWQVWESAPDDFDPNEDLVQIANRMKAKGYLVEDIAEITGLTKEEIKAI